MVDGGTKPNQQLTHRSLSSRARLAVILLWCPMMAQALCAARLRNEVLGMCRFPFIALLSENVQDSLMGFQDLKTTQVVGLCL